MSKKSNKSGKFVLRAGEELHARLAKQASEKGLSLNQYCLELLKSRANVDTHYEGIQSWTEKTIKLLKKIDLECEGIILFGSAARGEEQKSSDYDLLFVLEKDSEITSDIYNRFDQEDSSFLPNKASIQFVEIPQQIENIGSLWLEVAIDGIVLFDKSGNVKKLLQKIRSLIASGAIKRKLSHGHPYWVHNR